MDNCAEEEFRMWLDKNKIPYWYIDQSIDSFSQTFRDLMVKRPDFMILLPNIGFMFVDVKNKARAIKHHKYFIHTREVNKYLRMQRIFNIPIWFVISHGSYNYDKWFWIPTSEIIQSGFIFESKAKNEKVYSIPIASFVEVSTRDSMERIFSKLFSL